ncbi:uncharacterized protein LOC130739449 isoform X2 [Lotus japonicus]|uniref:uncharacterized protein LOC130739449 isoform X2 n=1 Tax=Lotus japonicus TaxID=34305 RepID=UPI002589D50B|nr:uncharacterized protein LOC130739449 isoform X2 [Lotus japonicus]
MDIHALQSSKIVCDIPLEGVKNTLNTESTVADERKNNKEFSSYTNQMKMVPTSVINEELSSETLGISLVRTQVGSLKKKLLVLDINGLLADIVSPRPKDHKADATIAGRAIFKRPFYLEFLKFCFEKFEVGIWSSRTKKNVQRVIDYLMGDMKNKLLFCWDLSHCTETSFRTLENKHKPLVFKDLRKLWEKHDPDLPWEKGYYNELNTLLLDDSPYKALLNPLLEAICENIYIDWQMLKICPSTLRNTHLAKTVSPKKVNHGTSISSLKTHG